MTTEAGTHGVRKKPRKAKERGAARRRRAPKRRRERTRLLPFGAFGTVAFGIVLLGIVAWASLLVWATLPPQKAEARPQAFVEFDWRPELDAWGGGRELASRGLLASPRLFALYTLVAGRGLSVEPGPHWLPSGLSARELLQRLARVSRRPAVKVTLPEGWDSLQIARRLEGLGVCAALRFHEALRSLELLSELGIPGASAEGYLFPATYDLLVDSEPAAVIRLLVSETEERLGKLAERHAGALERLAKERGFRRHEVLTLASIVEKEAATPDERRTIASVFLNRLRDPEFRPARRLQSDPTALYGCKIYPELESCKGSATVTPAMLRDEKNPYNTYRHPGLPPGPIASPGEEAISAVLAPKETDFLFFFATSDGTHRFSRTYEEHRSGLLSKDPESSVKP